MGWRKEPALSPMREPHFMANDHRAEASLDVALNPDIAVIIGPPGTGKTKSSAPCNGVREIYPIRHIAYPIC